MDNAWLEHNRANHYFQSLVSECIASGELIETRNQKAHSIINAAALSFDATPLVTLKKTAWKKALREMEWFLSGDPHCPEALYDWWKDQLYASPTGQYVYYDGYGHQMRNHGGMIAHKDTGYDQIEAFIDSVKTHPNSRRHIITTWSPIGMEHITRINHNPRTPATCHGTVIQGFVRDGLLHLKTYQRSADLLLGVPHNWIQYWGLLLWLAHRTQRGIGSLQWVFGDLHLYEEPSHRAVAKDITLAQRYEANRASLVYQGGDEFKADAFEMIGRIAEPVTTMRAKLL